MDRKIVFLDIVIFSTFLTLILSNVFLERFIDIVVIFILFVSVYFAYGFIYKFGNFQKILFIVAGFMIFLITGGFYSFYEDVLVYMQYIGALIVFATGVIGFAN